MRAGAKEIVITPDFPALLAGFPEPKDRYSRGVHDDLYAHCFYIESKGEEFAIITMDFLNFPKFLAKRMRERIREFAGVPEKNCLISTTHTHSGPITGPVPFYFDKQYDIMYPHYIENLINKVAQTIAWAKENSFEAKIGIGKGYCGPEQNVGGNRRDKNGIADTGLHVISIKDMNDKVRGVILRYSLHPTFLNQDNRLITSDYPGYAYKYLRNHIDGVVPAFQLGTAGDQSPRFFRSGCTYEEAERVGYTLAKEAMRVIDNMEYVDDPVIKTLSTEVEPIRKVIPTYEKAVNDLEVAKKGLEDAIKNNEEQGIVRSHECTVIGAERMLGWAKVGADVVYSINYEHPFEVFLMVIDDFAILGFQTETFVKYGLDIQAQSPYKNTVIVSCANGYGKGYICTPEALAEGGYEALGSLYTGENGDNLVAAALNLLNEAKGC